MMNRSRDVSKEVNMSDRIVSDPAILGGKPIVLGTRISVEMILEWMASGASRDDIVRNYPALTVQDVEQALEFAAAMLRNDTHVTVPVGS
jgi:uncharacterized protein (DUF433 family)